MDFHDMNLLGYDVGKPHINLPFGDGSYNPPVVILGIVGGCSIVRQMPPLNSWRHGNDAAFASSISHPEKTV